MSSLFKNPNHVLAVYGSSSKLERNHVLTVYLRIQLTVAWLNLIIPNKTVKNGLKAKKIKLTQMIFFSLKATNKTSMYLLAPFILRNFKKILRADPEL